MSDRRHDKDPTHGLSASDPLLLQGDGDGDARSQPSSKAATGASAASMRAVSAQLLSFYFRAPAKAFFRTRIDYMQVARAINPRVQANESWSWRLSTPALLAHAVRERGWTFIPDQVLPPLVANICVGAVLYTSYLQFLSLLDEPSSHSTKRVYPPPPPGATFTAGFAAGALQSVFAAPLDAVQARFKTSDILEGRFRNLWQYSHHTLTTIGLRGTFAGWGISFLKESLGFGIFFSTFEYVKQQSYAAFLVRYYSVRKPGRTPAAPEPGMRPLIKPHYALEPTFLLLAGAAASISQQLVQYPLTLVQSVYSHQLEALERRAKLLSTPTRVQYDYLNAYKRTLDEARRQAHRVGGWRIFLYRGFVMSTIKQVPSTSAGLIVFELFRRKYGEPGEATRLPADGCDILLA